MRTYLILLLLLAIAVPMAIKYGILHEGLKISGCGTGPCLINRFTDEPLLDRVLPNNLDNMKRVDAFQNELDNHPRDEMINMDGFQQNSQNENIGQNCQFGMCLPGQQAPQSTQQPLD